MLKEHSPVIVMLNPGAENAKVIGLDSWRQKYRSIQERTFREAVAEIYQQVTKIHPGCDVTIACCESFFIDRYSKDEKRELLTHLSALVAGKNLTIIMPVRTISTMNAGKFCVGDGFQSEPTKSAKIRTSYEALREISSSTGIIETEQPFDDVVSKLKKMLPADDDFNHKFMPDINVYRNTAYVVTGNADDAAQVTVQKQRKTLAHVKNQYDVPMDATQGFHVFELAHETKVMPSHRTNGTTVVQICRDARAAIAKRNVNRSKKVLPQVAYTLSDWIDTADERVILAACAGKYNIFVDSRCKNKIIKNDFLLQNSGQDAADPIVYTAYLERFLALDRTSLQWESFAEHLAILLNNGTSGQQITAAERLAILFSGTSGQQITAEQLSKLPLSVKKFITYLCETTYSFEFLGKIIHEFSWQEISNFATSNLFSFLEAEEKRWFQLVDLCRNLSVNDFRISLQTPELLLYVAASIGNKRIVNSYAQGDSAIPNKALIMALCDNDSDIVTLLKNNGADMDRVLYDAATVGNVYIIKQALAYDANVNCIYDGNRTPLHQAAKNGCESAITILLQSGAAIDSQDSNGDTPLHIAAADGDQNWAASILIGGGADVNKRNNAGCSPLSLAVTINAIDTVKDLLAHNAVIDQELLSLPMISSEMKDLLERSKREQMLNNDRIRFFAHPDLLIKQEMTDQQVAGLAQPVSGKD